MGLPRTLLLTVVTAVSCTLEAESLTPAQQEVVAAHVTDRAPTPEKPLEVEIDQRVRLLGYDLDRTEWKPGETLRVTWYWEVTAPPRKGSTLFTHIEDSRSRRRLEQDLNGSVRWLYGPKYWRAGQFVRDVQDLHLPADWSSPSANLYVGLAKDGDSNHRVLAATLPTPVRSDAAAGALPHLGVVQTKIPLKVDGSLADEAWAFAKNTGALVETRHGGPAEVEAYAKLLWDKRFLYVGVEVRDALLVATDTKHDSHLWQQDCVELMIDPDGDGKNYFEIQISPRGVLFDTRYDRRRIPAPFGRVDWDSRSLTAVSARGALDDAEADAGYTVELAIPWQAFSLDGSVFAPPRIGDRWRLNVYVMDFGRDRQRAAAWSPLGVGDFHVPQRFGILQFEGTPEQMMGTRAPIEIPEGRFPAPMRRGGVEPAVKDSLIQKRAYERRQMGAASQAREDPQRLESLGAGH